MSPARPVNILALLSEPLVNDAGEPVTRVDLLAAEAHVREQLRAIDRAAVLRFVPAISSDVLNALRDHGPFDLLHFFGHGNDGVLAFEDGRGGVLPMDARHVRALFAPDGDQPPATVALLSACHSASMAEGLLAAGVQHIIAIDAAQSVLNVAARVFASHFYPALLAGRTVRQAFDFGRVAVLGDADVRAVCRLIAQEQGLPEAADLFTRLEVGKFRLLPEAPDDQSDPHAIAPFADRPRGAIEIVELPRHPETIAARPEFFVGRERELHDVIASVLAHRVTEVIGTGGMGKSELCREAGRWFAARRRFTAGVTFVPLGAYTRANEARAAIAAALAIDLTQAQTPVALARLLPSDALLILDELDSLITDDRAEARALVQALHDHSAARVLIASRYPTGVTGVRRLPLLRLPPNAARQLFIELAEAQLGQALRGTDDELREVLGFLDCFPRAIVLAAKQLTSPDLKWLLADLRAAREEVLHDPTIPPEELKDGDSVMSTLNSSFKKLAARDPDAAAFFPYLALFPAGVDEEGLRAIFEGRARHLRAVLDYALAERTPRGYVYLPAPVRSYAERQLPPNAIDVIAPRALRHYYALADAYNDLIVNGQIELGTALFSLEFPNFELFLDWGYDHETAPDDEPVCYTARINALFGNFFVLADPGRTQIQRYRRSLSAAQRLGARLGEANVLQAIGDVQNFRDEREAALASYAEALQLFRAVGARLGEANVLQAIGDVQNFRDEREAALASYAEALQLFRAVGDRLGEANVFLSVGQMALNAGDEEHGVEYLEQATRLYEAIGAQSGSANVRITLARLAASKGEFQQAIDYMQPAADFGKRIRHPLGDQLQAQIDQWRQQLSGEPGVSQEDVAQQAFAEFLADVVAGARGDEQRGQRAYAQARALQGADVPAELQAIGRACQRLLEGLRGDDVLRDLPEEVKPLIAQLLEQIGQ